MNKEQAIKKIIPYITASCLDCPIKCGKDILSSFVCENGRASQIYSLVRQQVMDELEAKHREEIKQIFEEIEKKSRIWEGISFNGLLAGKDPTLKRTIEVKESWYQSLKEKYLGSTNKSTRRFTDGRRTTNIRNPQAG
jgi:hypothetical protein